MNDGCAHAVFGDISNLLPGDTRVFSPMQAGVTLPRSVKLRALAIVRMNPETRRPMSPIWIRTLTDGRDFFAAMVNDADGLVVVDRIVCDGKDQLASKSIPPSVFLLGPGPLDCGPAHMRLEVEIRSVSEAPISLVVLGFLSVIGDKGLEPEVLVPFSGLGSLVR